MDKPFVFLIHGILSDGSWHEQTETVLQPYFNCVSIRYRDYHALGPVNMFFWPWSLQLGAFLGWYATRESGLTGLWFCLAFAIIGLVEALFSGIARAVPWLLVAAFSWSAVPVVRQDVTLILTIAGVSLALHLLGDSLRRRIPRSLFFVALFWGGLVALLPLAAYGAGWILQLVTAGGRLPDWLPLRSPEVVLLAFLVALNMLNISLRELQWNRANSLWFVPAAMGAYGLVAAWVIGPGSQTGQSWWLWISLLLLMCFLEISESLGDRLADQIWRYVVPAIAVAAAIFWDFRDSASILWTAVAIFMLFGWYEPIFRAKRVAQNVHDLVAAERLRLHIVGRVHVIAHSLGAFLTGKFLDAFPLERYGQVILVGGAISERRKWIGDLDGPRPRVFHVRNEHGTLDFVIKLLWLSGAWADRHRMGGAGFVGISVDHAQVPVHPIPDFRAHCRKCPDPPARIHNYHFPLFTHTTYTSLASTHCWQVWLPCLWGFSPSDVHGFHGFCLDVLDERTKKPFSEEEFRDLLKEFLDSEWDFKQSPGPRRPLRELIREVVANQLELLDESHQTDPLPSDVVIRIAAMILYIRIARGIGARSNGTGAGRDFLYLNPRHAIIQASKRACHIVTVQLN